MPVALTSPPWPQQGVRTRVRPAARQVPPLARLRPQKPELARTCHLIRKGISGLVELARIKGRTMKGVLRILNPPTPAYLNPRTIRQALKQYPARSEEHTSELQSLMRISY